MWLRTRNAPSNLVCWLEGLTSMRSSGLEPGSRASAEMRVHDSMPFSHFTRFVVLYTCHFDSGWVGTLQNTKCISVSPLKTEKNPWSISRYKKSSGSGPEEGWLSYYNAGQRVAKRDLDSGALRFTAMRVSIDPRQAGSSVGWLLLGLLLLRRSLLPRTHLQDRY